MLFPQFLNPVFLLPQNFCTGCYSPVRQANLLLQLLTFIKFPWSLRSDEVCAIQSAFSQCIEPLWPLYSICWVTYPFIMHSTISREGHTSGPLMMPLFSWLETGKRLPYQWSGEISGKFGIFSPYFAPRVWGNFPLYNFPCCLNSFLSLAIRPGCSQPVLLAPSMQMFRSVLLE